MKSAAVIPHPDRSAAYDVAAKIVGQLAEIGVEVRIPEPEAIAMDRRDLAYPDDDLSTGLDLAVSVGGDGTMLRAVSLAKGVPVLGVNLGALGFLAEVEPEEAVPAILRLADGEFDVEERMTIDAHVRVDGERQSPIHRALNEVTIEKANTERMINVDMSINGEHFTSFRADGVLIATPTGSTAYALSLRGPIVSPAMQCMVIVPIAPHGLFDRSLVLAPWEEVEISVPGERRGVLAVDGRRKDLLHEDGALVVSRGSEPVRFVRFKPHRFHRVLSEKFGLDG